MAYVITAQIANSLANEAIDFELNKVFEEIKTAAENGQYVIKVQLGENFSTKSNRLRELGYEVKILSPSYTGVAWNNAECS